MIILNIKSNKLVRTGKLYFVFFVLMHAFITAQNAYQNIAVNIDVTSSYISVENTISLPKETISVGKIFFYLHKNLNISKVLGAKIINLGKDILFENNYIKKYQITFENTTDRSFTIFYSGSIKDTIESTATGIVRGFNETLGTISEKGIYLAGATYWLPKFEADFLSSFDLDVEIDKDWSVLSQGERIINEVSKTTKHIKYHAPKPTDEIYLVGGKWKEYSNTLKDVSVQVFLRNEDHELANKYLEITNTYINMYASLIGEYPYSKFALVENFWETGYGMPSFTLLGEKVIRFPWILTSSYPHELLHNYWGNGVFVDYSNGNWSEGLTAYMADHLIQEQNGLGDIYRRNTLKKYSDYVNEENDTPIKDFINRNNAAQEAIGYGKWLMVNDMLRNEIGDEMFVKSYQKFYKDNIFKRASFKDIQKSFEEVSGKNFEYFFNQWIDRKGVPKIEIVNLNETGNKLSFTLKQTQRSKVFDLNIPIAFFIAGNDKVIWKKVGMHKKEQNYNFEFFNKPLKIEVDPQFNLMRLLDRTEVPSSLSQVFGSKKSLLIIPLNSKFKKAYRALSQTWKKVQEAQGKTASIINDFDLKELPKDQSVWILGFENKFYKNKLQKNYNTYFEENRKEKIKSLIENGALVYVLPNKENAVHSVGFIGANSKNSILALMKKLPHYGKYSYLGFEGDSAKNVLKGTLPVLNSSLHVIINSGKITSKIIPRKALCPSK